MQTDNTLRVLKLIDIDAQFEFNQNQSGQAPVILNKFDMSEPTFVDQLREQVFSDGIGEDFIARCQCGYLEGNNRLGTMCPMCDTEVSNTNLLDEDNLICRNWVSCPPDLPGGWISPKIYTNLAYWLSYGKNGRNYLDDLLDLDAETPYEIAQRFAGKGFQYVHDHFDEIIEYFSTVHPVISTKSDTPAIRACLQLYRKQVFCHYIPVLNSAMSPIFSPDTGSTQKRRYSDPTSDYILDAAISLSRLEFSPKKRNHMVNVERTAYKAFKEIIKYVEEATRKYISNKKAIPRTHIFGSRFHWSIRGVVTPITTAHHYYELHIPWQMAVNTFRIHILGTLLREYNLTINEAISKVMVALQRVDPDIDKIFTQLIKDSPFIGLPVVWNRPPTIRDGSVMLKYITKIKTNIHDKTVGITSLDVALPNADFDGDNLAGILVMETEMVRAFASLSPDQLIFNRNTGEVSDEIGVHKTLAITWNSFLGAWD